MQDLVDYTIHKSDAETAHTRTADDATGASLLGSFRGLILYFKTENIGTELIEFYLNLTADRVFKSIPADSQITLEGNKLYLSSLFEYTKSVIRTLYQD